MPMSEPKGFDSKPFKEHFTSGEVFFLVAAKVVHTGNAKFGDDDRMIVLTIREDSVDSEYTIWGKYLVAQVESAEATDFGKPWKIEYDAELPNGRPGKMLVPAQDEVPI